MEFNIGDKVTMTVEGSLFYNATGVIVEKDTSQRYRIHIESMQSDHSVARNITNGAGNKLYWFGEHELALTK